LGLAFAGCAASAAPHDVSLFEVPLKTVHVLLPADPDNPQAKPEVRCTYFPRFAVKEIDTGQEGADQLSILPGPHGRAACRKTDAPDERVVPPDLWTGYFTGAVGNYLFFDADDGWNGGLGFAVFTPDAKKLFDDVARKWMTITPSAKGLTLHYVRVFGGKCSLGSAHAADCWKQIETATGLRAPMPDCRALYAQEQRRTPKFAKQVLEDPSAIEYPVETRLTAEGPRTSPLIGAAPLCRPQD
jgi:hypothetical protein